MQPRWEQDRVDLVHCAQKAKRGNRCPFCFGRFWKFLQSGKLRQEPFGRCAIGGGMCRHGIRYPKQDSKTTTGPKDSEPKQLQENAKDLKELAWKAGKATCTYKKVSQKQAYATPTNTSKRSLKSQKIRFVTLRRAQQSAQLARNVQGP